MQFRALEPMQFRALEPDIEVNGQTVFAVVDGFGAFTVVGSRFLINEGIGKADGSGVVQIDPAAWYSQEAWLRAFERISQSIGNSALRKIGMRIPENAIFPPWVQDVDSAIRSVDVAYHLNHRKHGQVMFDTANGQMLEGIGHYGYQRVSGAQKILSVCDNPYPCAFDEGILTTMARKFAPRAQVQHEPGQPCRQQGADSCTFAISW
jgi:hypothetical protein